MKHFKVKNPCLLFLAAALLCLVVQGSRFNIASTSTCTNTSATGFCTRWEQNGTVDEETAACFSGDMFALTKETGYKSLRELTIGDEILSYDRKSGQTYTPVIGWFHRDENKTAELLRISFKNDQQSIKVSPKHNIGIETEVHGTVFEYIFANELTSEKELFGLSVNNAVDRIEKVSQKGLYSPMTVNSNYFVFASEKGTQRLLAHDYAHVRNPEKYEFIVSSVISLYETFYESNSQSEVHPAAKWMMENFSGMFE